MALLGACDQDRETPTPQPAAPASAAANASDAAGAPSDEGQAAAAQPAASPTPAATPFVPVGDLVLWHSWAGANADALVQILTQLKQDAPLLNVETLFVAPNDLPQAYADAVAVGGGPDVAVTENWWIGNMAGANLVRPLDDLLQPGQSDEFYPSSLANFRRNGALYALPVTFETVSLFQNTAVTTGTLPATTSDLLAQAQNGPANGLGMYANLFHVWWGFPAYGAQLFDEQGRVIIDQGTGAGAYLQWLKDMNATPGSYVDSDYGMLIDRFKKGEFGYFVDGPWATAELREALGDSLTVVPLPAGTNGPAQPWIQGEGVILNPALDAQRAPLAFYLASILTSPMGATRFAEGGSLPANQRATLPDDPILRGFMAQAATAQPAPTQPEMEQVWGYGGDMLIKVLGGSVEPIPAARETAALINDVTGK
jgi:arabinogalactan oligomer/maltooligosaccharide transport system substrate-binding protein